MLTIWLVLIFVILLLLGMPIAFAMGLSSLIIIYFFGLASLASVAHIMFASLNSFILMAVPFFILAATFMMKGDLAKYIYAFAQSVVRPITGGMAIAVMITCMIFAAITGSSMANAAAIGLLALPILTAHGYDEKFSAGLIAAGGTLGILIPPSLTMILYGAITLESVGKLFIAGVVPGFIIGTALCIQIYFMARRRQMGSGGGKIHIGEVWQTFRKAFLILFMPLIILGGIYTGIFTPTESAVVATIYGGFVALFYYKSIKLPDILPILIESAETTSMIFLLVTGAMLMAFLITMMQAPQQIFEFIISGKLRPWFLLVILNVILLILGCFLDVFSCMLITLPIFFPVLKQAGVDPIHLAVIYTVNMEIATLTPPVGMNLFVLMGISKLAIEEIVRGVIPFLFVLIAGLILVTYVPILSTWLPSFMK